MDKLTWWKSPRERYCHDNSFHTLVDVMVNHMIDCHYTPSEMREAAILASIIYQEHYVRPQLLPTEVLNWLDGKEDSALRWSEWEEDGDG